MSSIYLGGAPVSTNEIQKLESRLIFFKKGTKVLSTISIFIFIGAFITASIFKLDGQSLSTILLMGVFQGLAFIDAEDKFDNIKMEDENLNQETKIIKGVKDE